jgi:hypothetical protein
MLYVFDVFKMLEVFHMFEVLKVLYMLEVLMFKMFDVLGVPGLVLLHVGTGIGMMRLVGDPGIPG